MPHPPIASQITFLTTRDLEESTRFYGEVMGLPLKLDQGSCRIYQVCQSGYVGFCRHEDSASSAPAPRAALPLAAGRIIFTLVTPEVDEWYAHLSNQGVHFEKTPTVNSEYQIYHFLLRDPNGYLIEVQQFLHPF